MRPKVLVVDDENGIRLTFDIFLSGEGYDVTTAGDYAEAMERTLPRSFRHGLVISPLSQAFPD